VIQITVSPAAYDAIKSSLPKGARKLTPMRDAAGEYLIHLEARRRWPPGGHARAGRELQQGDLATGRSRPALMTMSPSA
jgi:hypothetical protein